VINKIKVIECMVSVNRGVIKIFNVSKDREGWFYKRLLQVADKDKVIKIQNSDNIYTYYILETSKYFNVLNELHHCKELQDKLSEMYNHVIKIIEDNKDTVEIN